MPKLLSYLPGYYKISQVMINLTNAEEQEINLYKAKIETLIKQFFIETADEVLHRWEDECGLDVNPLKPITERRENVKAKLRGVGTVTVTMIKNVVDSYTNGGVDVVENVAPYTFKVVFNDIKGIPANMNDVYAAIERIKPAHLAVTYEFRYTVWQELIDQIWSYMTQFTWDQVTVREWS